MKNCPHCDIELPTTKDINYNYIMITGNCFNCKEEILPPDDPLDGLDSDELLSILKSNRLSHLERRNIRMRRHFLLVRELIPIVALVGSCAVILKILKDVGEDR